MTNANGWHLKPSVTLAIIMALFAGGIVWGVQTFRVEALEIKQKEQTQYQAISRERLGKIEITVDWVRADVREIKELVQRIERRSRRISSSPIRE